MSADPGTRTPPAALRAFRHRDFRLFFAGQLLSNVGTWMQSVAMSWLVYRLTGSALALGVIGFATQFPAFLISPIAGVFVDRWNRRRIVLTTQSAAMVQAFVLTGLVLTDEIRVWHLVALALVLGTINGFDIPARQAYLVLLVEGTEDLANAIALNSSMFNAARLVGPAVAGVLIGAVGEGVVFLLNAVSYLAVLAALLGIRARGGPVVPGRPDVVRNLREGFRYAFGFAPIRSLLLVLAVVSLVGMPYTVLLPVFASDVLGGGATTLGFLTSAAGFGALGGALFLASRSTVRGLSRVIAAGAAIFGFGLAALGFTRTLPVSGLVILLAGFGLMIFSASINTVLQTLTTEEMRGRVMSLYTMAFMGMAPFGSLFAGGIANRIGAPRTVLLGGVACLAAAAWFGRRIPALRALVHPLYVERGIIPEVATGIQAASTQRPRT